MKRALLICMPALSLLVAAEQHHQRPQPRYTVKDLGVLGAGTNSAGFGINHAGWVAGSSTYWARCCSSGWA